MPFLNQIQASFGQHDLSGARAHTDATAGQATDALNAKAVAHGADVAFNGAPDLATAAHEAAHLVQQAGGQGGVSSPGDSTERHADAVAQEVVAGRDASPLLDRVATPGRRMGSGKKAVQRKEERKEVSSKAMGRLTHAKAGIDQTKKVLSHGAGNQKEALEATKFNSYYRMAAMRDPGCWSLDASVHDLARKHPDALTAAKADLAQGGNCGEHAMIAYDYLQRTLPGDKVNRCDKEGLDHAFVIIGDTAGDTDKDLVVCDPWPTAPTACLWEDHFAFTPDRTQLNVRNTVSGDATDVKAAIAAGLSLSAKGRQMIAQSMSEEDTRKQIEKGTEGDHPWIWQHENAANTKYDYFAAEKAEEPKAAEEPAKAEESGGFIAWIRRTLGF